jgi:hypothetical protein
MDFGFIATVIASPASAASAATTVFMARRATQEMERWKARG